MLEFLGVLFFVYSGSIFDLNFRVGRAIMVIMTVNGLLYSVCVLLLLTTYLTIDTLGIHGNNGYKTAKEDLPWSGNRYKKPFGAERVKVTLFGCRKEEECAVKGFAAYWL
ncbi:MAG: hypothetical protein NC452_16760 [Eubacterium sp.]|nr:hypothetical protein [Eubacterium sp.]